MHYIYYFSDANGETEFVVISTQSREAVEVEYGDAEVQLQDVKEVDGDCTCWPCDRPLSK